MEETPRDSETETLRGRTRKKWIRDLLVSRVKLEKIQKEDVSIQQNGSQNSLTFEYPTEMGPDLQSMKRKKKQMYNN